MLSVVFEVRAPIAAEGFIGIATARAVEAEHSAARVIAGAAVVWVVEQIDACAIAPSQSFPAFSRTLTFNTRERSARVAADTAITGTRGEIDTLSGAFIHPCLTWFA
jgi:hypothetical protein